MKYKIFIIIFLLSSCSVSPLKKNEVDVKQTEAKSISLLEAKKVLKDKSFIKDLIKSAGLTSVPEYSNTQHKITYNISDRKKLIFNFVGATDSIDIKDENRPDLRGAENVKYNGNQYTAGLTLKSLLNKNGYHLFSLGKTLTNWKADVYKIEESFIDTFFYRENMESDNFLKWDLVYKINKKLEFSK